MKASGALPTDTEDRSPGASAGAGAGRPENGTHPADARAIQLALERSLQGPPTGDETSAKAQEPRRTGWSGAAPRRVIKIALGLALVGSLGWGPLRAMLATTSVEALVNARVETVRSPIEGVVASAPDVGRDWNASAPAPRLRIVDPLADHARLEDLRRQHQALESQSHLLARQSELASAALQTLAAQIERFREGRLKLLDARMAAQTAERETAAAKASEAAAAKRRTDELRKSGVSTAAEGDRTHFEWVAASSAETAAERRLEETTVERDAIAQGVFVGDSYNDSPSSEQRAAELRLRAGELDAQAVAVQSQIKLLDDQIADEEARYRERSEVLLDLPASGRVWEMLTGPGERVSKGQDLMRVLDCSHPLVSANVDESVYNRLEVGGRATFRPSQGGGRQYDGVIVNLTGAAAASGNFAIPPVAMRKSSFYVTVAVNGMSEGGCSVGRTGTVTFGTGDEAGGVAAAKAPAGGEDLVSLKSAQF